MAPTILVIDDDHTLVDMLTFVLNREGFETRVAFDGPEGLAILEQVSIDAVILDVMMPDMDGFEVSRRIRANQRISDLPILMLSARGQVTDKLAGFDVGVDDYVAKPAAIKEIIARIRVLLGRKQRIRAKAAPIITFVGAKGGVGATTVALNVALALMAAQRRTLFIELGGLGPTATWLLKIQPVQTLVELASGDGFRLSASALQTCIIAHRSGLHYLAVYRPGAPLAKLPAGILADALHLVENDYDAVIVDCGVGALGINNEALLHAGVVLPVVEHDSACLWHLSTLLEWLKASRLEGKVPGFVLVDRSPSATEDIPAMVARQARLGIVGIIPAATDVLYHTNSLQEPLYLADPDCAASSALSELAWRVMNQPIEIPPSFRP